MLDVNNGDAAGTPPVPDAKIETVSGIVPPSEPKRPSVTDEIVRFDVHRILGADVGVGGPKRRGSRRPEVAEDDLGLGVEGAESDGRERGGDAEGADEELPAFHETVPFKNGPDDQGTPEGNERTTNEQTGAERPRGRWGMPGRQPEEPAAVKWIFSP
jgi:hypothetical protein